MDYVCNVYDDLENKQGGNYIYACLDKNNKNDYVLRLDFSVDVNRDYIYHLEKFYYQKNVADNIMKDLLSNFMLTFIGKIQEFKFIMPKGTKYFSVRYQHNQQYKLKEWMPLLDSDGEYAYFTTCDNVNL